VGPTNGLVEAFLPQYDVSDTVACVVAADVETTWRALDQVDLMQVGREHPLVAALGFARVLPELASHLLHGETMPGDRESLRLRDTADEPAAKGGWILLGEQPHRELALGLVGKFWRPVIEYAKVDRHEFRDFAEPGWAKTAYVLCVSPIDDGRTLLSGTMRTATTDERARRWFRRYWTFGVGSGAHVLVNGLLDVVRRNAEAEAA
jgi:hypothetical protein